ncbi:D-lactate dehydrogenase, partial [Serratia sp. Se-PFBMAAmG]|nr:D-lactate dehydrogenase [Serratia sp. Se-PFBMAAmG]
RKLSVFAERLHTFPTEPKQQVFYIGTNDPAVLGDLRRHILAEFKHLPVAGEYMHRDIFDIAEVYGKDTFVMIDKLGTDKIPLFFTLKGRVDAWLGKLSFVKPHLTDRLLQRVSGWLPAHLPKRLKQYRDKFEHHLMLKMSGDGVAEAQEYLHE